MRTILMVPVVLVFAAACNKSSSSASDSPAASGSSASATAAPAATGLMGALKSAVAPGPAFEGELTLTATDARHPDPQTLVVDLKGQKIRFNLDSKSGGRVGGGIMDISNKKMITIMDAQRKYMEMDFGGSDPMMPHGLPSSPPPGSVANMAPPKIDKTGKHETVAGHECEDWNLTSADGRHGVVCMASDMGAFALGNMGTSSFVPSFVHDSLFSGSVFPLKMIDYDASGKEKMHAEVTRIDRKSLDDSLFAPPAGYTKMDLGNMGAMGGFGAHGMPGMPAMPGH